MAAIKFWKTDEVPYGCFSNFTQPKSHDLVLDGKTWPSVEHYFQAAKFFETAPAHAEAIRAASTPVKAKSLGRSRSHPIHAEWDTLRDGVMLKALRAKYQPGSEIAALLLGTGDAPIIEASPVDAYWGWGEDGKGCNMLGKLLVQVRGELRAAAGAAAEGGATATAAAAPAAAGDAAATAGAGATAAADAAKP